MRSWQRVQRERRLLCEGVAAEAVDLESRAESHTPLGTCWEIRYRYRDGAGRAHVGRARLFGEEAFRWKPGHGATVLYDPSAPGESIWIGRM